MRSFCSGVPSDIRVGPTLLRVSRGRGTPAQWDSSTKIIWSIGPRRLSAVFRGPPEAQPPVLAHPADVAEVGRLVRTGSLHLVDQSDEVGAELVLELGLFCCQCQVHRTHPPGSTITIDLHYRRTI